MTKETQKNYTQIQNKLNENFEDVKYLIGLHNQVLEKLRVLTEQVDRMQQNIDAIHQD